MLAQLADTLTFIAAVPSAGAAAEQNPVIRALYASHGALGPVGFKLLAIFAILCVMWRARRGFHRSLFRVAAVLAIAAGLLGVWGNLVMWSIAAP